MANNYKTPVVLDKSTKQHRPLAPNEKINASAIAISKAPGNILKVKDGKLYAKACSESQSGG